MDLMRGKSLLTTLFWYILDVVFKTNVNEEEREYRENDSVVSSTHSAPLLCLILSIGLWGCCFVHFLLRVSCENLPYNFKNKWNSCRETDFFDNNGRSISWVNPIISGDRLSNLGQFPTLLTCVNTADNVPSWRAFVHWGTSSLKFHKTN